MVQYVIDSEGTVTVEGAAITVEKSGFEGVLLRDTAPVARLEARSTGEQTSVSVDAAGECTPAILGIALAHGSMIGYLLGMRQ